MEAKIRLDQSGSPYLVVSFTEPDLETSGVQEDAERLFFAQLRNNGGVLHVYPSRNNPNLTKVLVVSNVEKRGAYKLSDAPAPAPRRRPEAVLAPMPQPVVTPEPQPTQAALTPAQDSQEVASRTLVEQAQDIANIPNIENIVKQLSNRIDQ